VASQDNSSENLADSKEASLMNKRQDSSAEMFVMSHQNRWNSAKKYFEVRHHCNSLIFKSAVEREFEIRQLAPCINRGQDQRKGSSDHPLSLTPLSLL